MEYAFFTSVGRRFRNEDSYYVPRRKDALQLIIVADGMGGHAAGARASMMAVEGVSSRMRKIPPTQVKDSIQQVIAEVNEEIYHHSRIEEGCRGMGTTLTLAVLDGSGYTAANIGDSRLYHFDGETLKQVTHDHSFVAYLVEKGAITREEAVYHPQRNIITKALGTSMREQADLFYRKWQPGDILMLSTDGMHSCLTNQEMISILSEKQSLQDTAELLVTSAICAGSQDNVTVVLARMDGGDAV